MQNVTVEMALRVLLSGALGGIVGLQRELTDRPAGIRTHILVTAGSCIFTAVSLFGFPQLKGSDRVAAGVVTGIGFIGGGAILRSRGGIVIGLTTAASLWSCAAIGMLVGTGFYLVGLMVAALDLLVLEILDLVVDFVVPRFKRRKMILTVSGEHTPRFMVEMTATLRDCGCCPEILQYQRCEGGKKVSASFSARIPSRTTIEELTGRLLEVPGASEVTWN